MTQRLAALVALLLVLLPSPPTAAPAADAVGSPPDAVFDRYVQALGGQAALAKLTSRVTKAEIAPAKGEPVPVEIDWKAPDRWLETIDAAGAVPVRIGYDGRAAWTQDSQGAVSDIRGDLLAEIRHHAALQQPSGLKALYSRLTVKGDTKLEGHKATVIEAARGDGRPETLYFDTTSGLLVRRDVARQTAGGERTAQITYGDYRAVDGVQIPFLIRRHHDAARGDFSLKVTEVRHNVALDDARFRKPAS